MGPATMDLADPLPLVSPTDGGRHQRPWGWFETLAEGEGYRVKRLRLHAGHRISLQRHHHRCEHWVVVAGEGTIECEGRQLQATVGTAVFIPVEGVHRASAADAGLEIIEVQRGTLLSEDDIERLEDDFGRVVKFSNSL